MMQGRAEKRRRLAWITFVGALFILTGCDGFFPPVTPVPPATTPNFVYVANATTNSIGGFSLASGTLKTVSNSPLTLKYAPQALVVTRNNKFLYVAAPGNIVVYTINSDGSLSDPNKGAGVVIANVVSMDVSPDGNWLLALEATTLQAQIDVFKINNSNGTLAAASPATYPLADATIVPSMLRISPNGALVFAALGTAGDVVFTFDTATGALIASQHLSVADKTSDNALAVDSATANLYVGRSGTGGGVHVFRIGTAGALNEIARSPFDSGGQAYSIALDNTGKYAYAANRLNGTIYGYSIGTGGGLTALPGSPYTSGTQVTSLGMDNSGKYLLAAAAGGGPDLSMYSFDATSLGDLDLAGSAATDIDPAGAFVVALTHSQQ